MVTSTGNSFRVGIVTKGGATPGGATRIALDLGEALRSRRDDAKLFCYNTTPTEGDGNVIDPTGFYPRIMRHVDWRLERIGLVRHLTWERDTLAKIGALDCDVLHFHDVFECTSPNLLAKLARQKAVVLTVHDCSTFTGGCLYPLGCRRYEASCGKCPQARRIGSIDFTRLNLSLRRKAAGTSPIHFVFPSRWIKAEAEKSLPITGRSHWIPNGFHAEPYSFPSQAEARARLGLAESDRVVLMGAHSLGSPYKGADFAVRALRAAADLDPVVLMLGNPNSDAGTILEGMRVVAPGFVMEKCRLAEYYAAADLMLFPSLADNLPIMVQESMAAATPVLAFRTGGIPEMLDHGETGWLVELGNQAELDRVLRAALLEGIPHVMGEIAREVINQRFSMDDFVTRHFELYRKLLEERA